MTDATTPPGDDRTAAPRPFPPLGNADLCAVAIAELSADPTVDLARRWAEALPDGPCGPLPSALEGWLATAVRAANDRAFRFELRGIGDVPGPRLADLAAPDAELTGIATARHRGTVKLVVALALHGPGQVELTAAGLDERSTLRAGTLAIWPAFLSTTLSPLVAGSLRTLVIPIHGPAFR